MTRGKRRGEGGYAGGVAEQSWRRDRRGSRGTFSCVGALWSPRDSLRWRVRVPNGGALYSPAFIPLLLLFFHMPFTRLFTAQRGGAFNAETVGTFASPQLQNPVNASPSCVCNTTEPYPEWIAVAFRECVITQRDYFAFWVGLSSLAFWIFAQAPQFIKNCRLGSASGLSVFFLFQWMLGDSLNFVSSILTGQLGTVIYTSGLFVSMDIVLFVQYVALETRCFACSKAGSRRDASVNGNSPLSERLLRNAAADSGNDGFATGEGSPRRLYSIAIPLLFMVTLGFMATEEGARYPHPQLPHAAGPSSLRHRRLLASTNPGDLSIFSTAHAHAPPICDASSNSYKFLGTVLAWSSAGVYLLSRLPQLVKNVKRGSVEGLSPIMFFCAVMGNLTYAASIFIKGGDLASAAPVLTGSLGTLGFDFTILCQFLYYKGRAPRRGLHLKGSPTKDGDVPRGVHGIVDWQASPWLTPSKRMEARNETNHQNLHRKAISGQKIARRNSLD